MCEGWREEGRVWMCESGGRREGCACVRGEGGGEDVHV